MSLYSNPALTPSTWTRRHPITVYDSGGGTTKDVEVVIPDDWDDFWTNVRSSGEDIRITAANGSTLQTFGLSGFNKTNRTGTIQIDAVTLTANQPTCLWLYWGHATATTAATSPGMSSPVTGYIDLTAPSGARVVRSSEQSPSSSSSTLTKIGKAKADIVPVFVIVDDLLPARQEVHGDSSLLDELASVTYEILNVSTPVAGMISLSAARFVSLGSTSGAPAALMLLVQSSSASVTDYTISATATTARGWKRNVRAPLYVYDYGV